MILAFLGFLVGFVATWKVFRAVIGCWLVLLGVGSAGAFEGRVVFVNDTETPIIFTWDDNGNLTYPFWRLDQSDGGDHLTGQLMVPGHAVAKAVLVGVSANNLGLQVQDASTRGQLEYRSVTATEWTNKALVIAWGPCDNYVDCVKVFTITEAAYIGWAGSTPGVSASDALAGSVGTIEHAWWGFIWGCGTGLTFSMLRLVRTGLVDWTGSGG